MKQVAAIFGVFAMTCASPVMAQSECQPEFVQVAQTVSLNDIEVGAGNTSTETFEIRIRNAADENASCRATLRIARLSTAPSLGRIGYTLQAQGRILQVLQNESFPGTAESDLDIPQLPSTQTGIAVPVRVFVPSNWGLEEGAQVDDLLVFLLDQTGVVADELRLTLSLNVPPAVEIRTVGATGRDAIASIDLGTLDPNSVTTSNPFGVRVWSTSPYTISFRSENDGRLKHTSASNTIDYNLFMDGNEVNVMGLPAGSEPEGTDALGDFHPMQVRVYPFEMARAGDYSDRVEVTVTAN